MIINPIDFQKKLINEYNIERSTILDIFNSATADDDFLKQMNFGFRPYLVLEATDKQRFSVVNIKTNTDGENYLNQDHITAVDGFKYLKEILAN